MATGHYAALLSSYAVVLLAMYGIARRAPQLWPAAEQPRMGHKRIDETMLYVHVAENQRREIPDDIVMARAGYLAHPGANMAGVGRASGSTAYLIRAPTGHALVECCSNPDVDPWSRRAAMVAAGPAWIGERDRGRRRGCGPNRPQSRRVSSRADLSPATTSPKRWYVARNEVLRDTMWRRQPRTWR